MSDALSFAEIDRQHVELLPARTVLSMVSTDCGCTVTTTTSTTSQSATGAAGTPGATGTSTPGLTGGAGGAGGQGMGKAAFIHDWFYTEGDVYNSATGGVGAPGGAGGAVSSAAPTGGGMH
ncbi:MAG: hypothetical protein JO115_21905 [Pseudonocardiales bacterium]|nr:hypothetical protein [Pseudonocardiales bacterium]